MGFLITDVLNVGGREMSLYDEKIHWSKWDNKLRETYYLENKIKKSIQELKEEMSNEILRIDMPLGITQIEDIIEEVFGEELTSFAPKTQEVDDD